MNGLLTKSKAPALHAAHPRQLDVEEDHVGVRGFGQRQRGAAVLRGDDREAAVREILRHHLDDRAIVVHDEELPGARMPGGGHDGCPLGRHDHAVSTQRGTPVRTKPAQAWG